MTVIVRVFRPAGAAVWAEVRRAALPAFSAASTGGPTDNAPMFAISRRSGHRTGATEVRHVRTLAR